MRRSRQPSLLSTPQKVSRGTIALLAGLCAVAVLLSGVVIAGFVAPDRLRTASVAVPPQGEAPLPAGDETEPSAPATAQAAVTAAPVKTPAAASTPKVDRPAPTVAASQPAATEPLAANDTRWGAAVAAQPEAGDTADAVPQQLAAGPDERGQTQTASPASEALADLRAEPAPDSAATASISTAAAGSTDDVAVAESEAEVAKLEAATGMIEGQIAATSQEPGTDLANAPLPSMKTARVTKYVNLRAGPADESRVIAVVPANAEVKVESGCQWCTVVYNGQRGYIYKSFIRRSLREAAAEGTGLF